jgi:transposase
MWIDYTKQIEESPSDLRKLEKKRADSRSVADRLKMLQLLKEGACRSRSQVAKVLGYSERQLGSWFDTYRQEGLEALCQVGKPGGGQSERVTPEAWKALIGQMKQGEIARLKDAQRFLAEQFEITYESISGISRLFARHGVKLKTGRRRHHKADAAKQAAFKK